MTVAEKAAYDRFINLMVDLYLQYGAEVLEEDEKEKSEKCYQDSIHNRK